MRGDIIAKYPEDIGKSIRTGGDWSEVLAATDLCEGYNNDCQKKADFVIQGETDSFGWEPYFVCKSCLELQQPANRRHEEALDVEDRAPKPGHLFYISEGTNNDGHGDWQKSFKSFRAAKAFHRDIEIKAEPYCGLWPRNGIQELPEAEVAQRFASAAAELAKEEAFLHEQYGS
jgi:hypothetical protein